MMKEQITDFIMAGAVTAVIIMFLVMFWVMAHEDEIWRTAMIENPTNKTRYSAWVKISGNPKHLTYQEWLFTPKEGK